MPLSQPYIGQQVRYVLPDGNAQGEVRGATVTKVWNSTTVNLEISLDLNDYSDPMDPLTRYKTNVTKGDSNDEGQWHFIPVL